MDILYVRTWIRRSIKIVNDEELECFKEWETEFFQQAEFYDGDVEPNQGLSRQRRTFEDFIEDWERNSIDGTGPGARRPLSQVKRDAAATVSSVSMKNTMVYFLLTKILTVRNV